MRKLKLPLVIKVLIAILLGVGLGHLAPAIADVGQKAGKMLLITVGLAYAFTVCSGLFAYLFSVEIFPHILDTSSLGALEAAGKVGPVLGSFLAVVAVIFVMTLVLLLLQYCVAGIVAKRNPFRMLAGMLPAYMTALGTAPSPSSWTGWRGSNLIAIG